MFFAVRAPQQCQLIHPIVHKAAERNADAANRHFVPVTVKQRLRRFVLRCSYCAGLINYLNIITYRQINGKYSTFIRLTRNADETAVGSYKMMDDG